MRQLGLSLCALAVLLVHGTASAGTVRDDRSDSQYQALGAADGYLGVGRFQGTTASGNFSASGTLIAPDWVLTAGHVVDAAKSLIFTLGGTRYSATNWVANPQWHGDLMAGYDIALVHLNSPVTGVQPAVRYTGAAEVGLVGTAVGFGMTGTGATGTDHLRRPETGRAERHRPAPQPAALPLRLRQFHQSQRKQDGLEPAARSGRPDRPRRQRRRRVHRRRRPVLPGRAYTPSPAPTTARSIPTTATSPATSASRPSTPGSTACWASLRPRPPLPRRNPRRSPPCPNRRRWSCCWPARGALLIVRKVAPRRRG